MAAAVRLRTKLFSWLILGTLSVFFAEVAGGSAPFPFYDAWGLYAVLPLYTLHIVFLAFAVMRPARRVPFTALFCAGAVFGLYEAYITKVIWDPTWGEKGLAVGGCTSRRPRCSSCTGTRSWPSSRRCLRASCCSRRPRRRWRRCRRSSAVPGLLVFLWLRAPGGTQRAGLTLRDLLPDGWQGLVIGVLLAAFYVATGLLIRPEAIPCTIVPHLSVWALYALFCGLAVGVLLRAMRKDSTVPCAATPAAALPARGRLIAAAAAFVASLAAVSAALSPFKAAAGALAMVAGLAGMAAGLAITVAALVAVIRRP
jgi:hypothetical protein